MDRITATGKPMLLSSGMSSIAELDRAVAKLKTQLHPFSVPQCSSNYPMQPKKLGLNLLEEYGGR